MDEIELIQSLRKGDEVAFKFLVDNYQDRVFNTAIGIVQNAEDAEDVAQEVFIQVFRSIQSFKAESKLSTWIYRITTTRALDHLRSRKSKKRFGILQRLFGDDNEALFEVPDFNHPGVALDHKENAAHLFKAIDKLPENQRIAFILHKIEGLSYQEISEIMKTSVAAIESMMHRAKQNLRKILEKDTG
ncbi:MAG: RNA polymerase sigma factor [Bacteroidia bacterium]|nr:RNA polymerase sigma factor [Bacteroidia bacterium]